MIDATHAMYLLVILILGAIIYFSLDWQSELGKSIDRSYCESVQKASWKYPNRDIPQVDVELCQHYGIEL